MSPGFDRAKASFSAYAASVLKTSPDHLSVGPYDEGALDLTDETVGRAWSFEAWKQNEPSNQVHAWVIADGTLVTPQQNLGILFDEAGVWSGAPKLDANRLAQLIVWAYGQNHRVFINLSGGVPNPSLQVNPDGTGALKFTMGSRQSGPGGAGGGPETLTDITVALSPGKKAELRAVQRPL